MPVRLLPTSANCQHIPRSWIWDWDGYSICGHFELLNNGWKPQGTKPLCAHCLRHLTRRVRHLSDLLASLTEEDD